MHALAHTHTHLQTYTACEGAGGVPPGSSTVATLASALLYLHYTQVVAPMLWPLLEGDGSLPSLGC